MKRTAAVIFRRLRGQGQEEGGALPPVEKIREMLRSRGIQTTIGKHQEGGALCASKRWL